MKKNNITKSLTNAVQSFMQRETASGIFLICAAIAAMIMANSPLSDKYELFSHLTHLPINDGLMVIFFFLVGIEIKREMVAGELSSTKRALLPIIAAAAGMVVPAIIYATIVHKNPQYIHGWAIPAATDIAFALGVLSLLGNRVPKSLKILLLSIAVIDDLGAIIIIALFYTSQLSIIALAAVFVLVNALLVLNRRGVMQMGPYIAVGILLWAAILASGVHATIAGVITALFIPRQRLVQVEHALHPFVAFGIMPLFAFANAGVSLTGFSLQSLLQPLPLGIAAGLFFGKQIGIFLSIFAAVRLKIVALPKSINWLHIYGLSALCGIGFTMSLFIGSLAFNNGMEMHGVRLGVLAGSLLSSIWGYAVLRSIKDKRGL